MSHVTSLMLATAAEAEVVAQLNDQFGAGFVENSAVAEAWGGIGPGGGTVHATALNHAALADLFDLIAQLPWVHPHRVQLFVKDQEDWFFHVYMIKDGTLRNVIPRAYLPDLAEAVLASTGGRRPPTSDSAGSPARGEEHISPAEHADLAALGGAAAEMADALGDRVAAGLGRLLVANAADVTVVRLGIALLRRAGQHPDDRGLADRAERHDAVRTPRGSGDGDGAGRGHAVGPTLADALSVAAGEFLDRPTDVAADAAGLHYLDYLVGRLYDFARPIPLPLIDRFLAALERARPVGPPWAVDKLARYARDPDLDIDDSARRAIVVRCLFLGARYRGW